jgi:hypothetical protein
MGAAFELITADNGSKLQSMVGAVIYIRVSTKEQTENLSLPTQLRACEEYCRREGYEVLERFREDAQGQGSFRRRLQPHAVRARKVRPLRAPVASEIARHLLAIGD